MLTSSPFEKDSVHMVCILSVAHLVMANCVGMPGKEDLASL